MNLNDNANAQEFTTLVTKLDSIDFLAVTEMITALVCRSSKEEAVTLFNRVLQMNGREPLTLLDSDGNLLTSTC